MARVKLTPEQIEQIEDICTMYMDGLPQRAIIVKHNLTDIACFSGFVRVFKDLGVLTRPIGFRGIKALDPQEALEVANYIAEIRRRREKQSA